MAEYVYIQNYARRGTLAISSSVFNQIVSIAMEKIKGAKLKKKKGSDIALFSLHHPVHCEFKGGRITTDLEVIISQNANVNEVCLTIQEEVAYALTSMTEFIPFSINVKVVGIE